MKQSVLGSVGLFAIFACAAAAWADYKLTTLISFDGTNGSRPAAGLIADASGNLYGTTNRAGANGFGTVFELSPVPEPSSLLLATLGFFGLAIYRGRTIQ